jgi:two-component system sensor kinase FixL
MDSASISISGELAFPDAASQNNLGGAEESVVSKKSIPVPRARRQVFRSGQLPTSKRLNADITEVDHASCEAQEGNASSPSLASTLAEADRRWSIDRAISALAHEMAQPLSSIANYANACVRLLQAGTASREELIDAMQQTAAEALRANELIRRARGNSAHANPRRVLAAVNDLVREVVAAQEATVDGHKIKVSLRLADELPDVMVDRVPIQLVLQHLIRNAIEAMSGIPPEQRLLTIETLAAGDGASVRVVDSGPSIDAAILAKLFEPYFTTKPHALGLGLSVCQMLIKAHAGRLWAQPNNSSGLAVQFTLPFSVE